MAPAVSVFIMGNSVNAVALCGDDCFGVSAFQFIAQMIGIESFVCQESIELKAIDQVIDACNLAALAGKQLETHKVSQSIGERKNLGR